jgi:hypothetical protein
MNLKRKSKDSVLVRLGKIGRDIGRTGHAITERETESACVCVRERERKTER